MSKLSLLKIGASLLNKFGKFHSIKFNLCKELLGVPVKSKHADLSIISAPDDEPSTANEFLIDLSVEAIKNAQKILLDEIFKGRPNIPFDINMWPGTHFRLLAGMILKLQPKLIIEIGTGFGVSTLTIRSFLPKDSKFITFDLVPWNKFPNTLLKKSDFNESFIQYTDDLSSSSGVLKHKDLLKSADVLYIDAAKDGLTEYRLLENFERIKLKEDSVLIFDDIKVWNMLAFWSNMVYPKLDLTSFGNWSGTGVIHWKNK